MAILTDILLVCVMLFAGYSGSRRGAVLIGLELVCFVLASAAALTGYRAAGDVVAALGPSRALANVIGFTVLWVIVELAAAFIIRFTIVTRLHAATQLARANQIGGSFLNILKFSILASLAFIVVAALPVSSAAKHVVTGSYLAQRILGSTAAIQHWLSSGLGHDITDSLNFYTISAEPESTEHIDLGFTAGGKIDEADETAMLALINRERTSRGFDTLTLNTEARTVARAYSMRMLHDGYFSHVDPDGHGPFQRLQAAGVTYTAAGENLALAPTLELAHQGLMNSPGHRANILSTNYTKVGIGIIDAGQYGLMVTQEFTN